MAQNLLYTLKHQPLVNINQEVMDNILYFWIVAANGSAVG